MLPVVPTVHWIVGQDEARAHLRERDLVKGNRKKSERGGIRRREVLEEQVSRATLCARFQGFQRCGLLVCTHSHRNCYKVRNVYRRFSESGGGWGPRWVLYLSGEQVSR